MSFYRELKTGINPQEKDLNKKTIKEIAEEWCEKFLPKFSKKDRQRKIDYFNRFIYPSIGHIPIKELTPKNFIGKCT
jgi:hypothetical protein